MPLGMDDRDYVLESSIADCTGTANAIQGTQKSQLQGPFWLVLLCGLHLPFLSSSDPPPQQVCPSHSAQTTQPIVGTERDLNSRSPANSGSPVTFHHL